MGWYFVGPAIPFVIAIFTSSRLPAVMAAAAGYGAGMAALISLGLEAHSPIGTVLLLFLVLIFAAMAFAEAAVASIFSGGGFVAALGASFCAHLALYVVIWRYGFQIHEEWNLPTLLVPPALLGGSAAAFGARLGRKRR